MPGHCSPTSANRVSPGNASRDIHAHRAGDDHLQAGRDPTLQGATGSKIKYVEIPDKAARQGMPEQVMPDFITEFSIKLFGAPREGIAENTNDTVRSLTGREPRTFAKFAHE